MEYTDSIELNVRALLSSLLENGGTAILTPSNTLPTGGMPLL